MRHTDQRAMKCLLPKTDRHAEHMLIIYGTRHHTEKPETRIRMIVNEALKYLLLYSRSKIL